MWLTIIHMIFCTAVKLDKLVTMRQTHEHMRQTRENMRQTCDHEINSWSHETNSWSHENYFRDHGEGFRSKDIRLDLNKSLLDIHPWCCWEERVMLLYVCVAMQTGFSVPNANSWAAYWWIALINASILTHHGGLQPIELLD